MGLQHASDDRKWLFVMPSSMRSKTYLGVALSLSSGWYGDLKVMGC